MGNIDKNTTKLGLQQILNLVSTLQDPKYVISKGIRNQTTHQ